MDIEDLEPQHKKPKPKSLDDMSIEALGEYIADLEAEIIRVRAAIEAKQAAQHDADSVFKR